MICGFIEWMTSRLVIVLKLLPGGGSCDPADSTELQVEVLAQVAGTSTPIHLNTLAYNSYRVRAVVLYSNDQDAISFSRHEVRKLLSD